MLNFPISHAEFLSDYFEQQPLLCTVALRAPAMAWQDLDLLLNTVEANERLLQIFLNGQVPPANFLDDIFEFGRNKKRINKHNFYNFLENGATLVLNQIEEHSVAAKRVCKAIAKFAQQPTSSNAYISFNSSAAISSTFGKHWDTHDVFTIQMLGKKRWRLYPPTLTLPLSHQVSAQATQPPSTNPAFEYVLSEGDLLYIPRGWWHEVTPLNSDSLHLSVGTYPATLCDYMIWMCRSHLPQLADARKSCSNDTAAMAVALQRVMKIFSEQVLNKTNMQQFINNNQEREHLTGEFHTDLLLSKSIDGLSKNMQLALSSNYPINPASAEIALNGGRLKLNSLSHAITNLLNQRSSLTWGELSNELAHFPAAPLREAVLDLIRYEVVNLTVD